MPLLVELAAGGGDHEPGRCVVRSDVEVGDLGQERVADVGVLVAIPIAAIDGQGREPVAEASGCGPALRRPALRGTSR